MEECPVLSPFDVKGKVYEVAGARFCRGVLAHEGKKGPPRDNWERLPVSRKDNKPPLSKKKLTIKLAVVVSPKEGCALTLGSHSEKMGKIHDVAATSDDIGDKHANPKPEPLVKKGRCKRVVGCYGNRYVISGW